MVLGGEEFWMSGRTNLLEGGYELVEGRAALLECFVIDSPFVVDMRL